MDNHKNLSIYEEILLTKTIYKETAELLLPEIEKLESNKTTDNVKVFLNNISDDGYINSLLLMFSSWMVSHDKIDSHKILFINGITKKAVGQRDIQKVNQAYKHMGNIISIKNHLNFMLESLAFIDLFYAKTKDDKELGFLSYQFIDLFKKIFLVYQAQFPSKKLKKSKKELFKFLDDKYEMNINFLKHNLQ